MQTQQAPEGYRENTQGHFVPLSKIDKVDLARDELVKELVSKAKSAYSLLSDTKKQMMGDVAAFCALSAEEYGVNYGGNKGNVTLLSYDGKYKVTRAMQDNISFDERLQTARELINACLREWTEGSPDELKAIVDRAFDTDKEGNISAGRILGLRRIKITDARWQEAMRAISDGMLVTGSKAYVRVYERDADGKYQPIPLDMAAV